MPSNSINSLLSSARGVDKGILANSDSIKGGGVARVVNSSITKEGIIAYSTERIDTTSIIGLINDSFSSLGEKQRIYDIISKFDKYINPTLKNPSGEAKENPACISMLSEIIVEKFRQINSSNQTANYSKIDFVQSLKNFTNAITDFSDDLQSAFSESTRALSNDIQNANSVIDKIHQNNIKIRNLSSSASNSSMKLNYLDRRDELISELANYLSFETKFDSNGAARIKVGNIELTGECECTYIVLADESRQYNDLGEFIDNSGKISIGLKSASGGSYINVNDLGGGYISGSLEVINNKLPQYKKMINEYVSNSAEVLNYANSYGISEKGNRSFISTKKTRHDSVMRDTDITTISVVRDGKSIGDEHAKIIAYDFDFEGKTVSEALKEINQKLKVGVSQKSIDGIGNIKLVNSSKASGILNFNLEFENHKDCKTKFQITGIAYGTGAGAVYNDIPQAKLSQLNLTTEVGSGKCVLNSQVIPVDFGAQNPGSKIKLTVNAIGEDGTITLLEIEYKDIDMSAAQVNEIYYLDSANAAANVGGPYNIPKTFAGFSQSLVAKLVNENGVEIAEGDGYISIEGVGDNNVIMCDKFRGSAADVSKSGLVSRFGMNNLIDVYKDANYSDGASNVKIKIHEEILLDPSKISASSITHAQSEINTNTGREDAIKLVVSDNGGGGRNFAYGNTFKLTILGREYAFTFAANSNGMNVQPGANLAASVQNLYEKLRNHADLSQILDFQHNGLELSIKSKIKGGKSATNPINVKWVLDGGGNAQIQAVNFYDGAQIKAVSQNENTDLQNGTDESKNIIYEKSAFTIASISNEVVSRIANIIQNKTFSFTDSKGVSKTFNFESSSSGLFETLNDISLEAENDNEYYKAKTEDAQNSWAESVGIDLQKIRMEVDRLTNLKYVIISVAQKIMSSDTEINRLIAAA